MQKFEPYKDNTLPVCASCHCPIRSRFLLGLSHTSSGGGDGEIIHFHVSCLRCSRCGLQLDESDERCWANRHFGVLCQSCYKIKTHCAKCKFRMPRGSLVYRIFDCVFHLDCFTCSRCNWRLQFGEYIAFAEGEIFCACHLRTLPPPPLTQLQSKLSETSWSDPGQTNVDSIENPFTEEIFDGAATIFKEVFLIQRNIYCAKRRTLVIRNSIKIVQWHSRMCQNKFFVYSNDKSSQSKPNSMGRASSVSETVYEENITFDENGKIPTATPRSFIHQGRGHHGQQQQRSSSRSASASSERQQRSKRVRTSFTPQQIAVLQASFKTVSNPDGQELERIAQATCLTKRVTQVWFQNARARKKKSVQNSLMHQQSSPRPHSLVCSNDVQGEMREAFISNPPPTDACDHTTENNSEVLTSSPMSSHLISALKDAALGSYFTKGEKSPLPFLSPLAKAMTSTA
ncbi:LIM/homeobox protein Awh [Taenia crassiceps]|uniref:LIM/homeobox protein Awh n=1 Tax=Taenia crassiceps TaxID=6207 RepID=A0ABR4QIV8_9CEST